MVEYMHNLQRKGLAELLECDETYNLKNQRSLARQKALSDAKYTSENRVIREMLQRRALYRYLRLPSRKVLRQQCAYLEAEQNKLVNHHTYNEQS